ncbi:MAG TPA: hypothetical protein VMH79_09570 [Thermoanaerobaculia bacterium]|nr:hypothetical protein [Thermoanaerobaculia bacterium]
MRRVGIVFLAVGLAGFLALSGAARPGGWAEDARWVVLGAAVMGLVFAVLPGKDARSS